MTQKKKPQDLTDEEAIRRLFPKRVVSELKRETGQDAEKPAKPKESKTCD